MFLLKNLIRPWLYPTPLGIVLLGIGVILLWFTRREKLGMLFCTASLVLLTVFSFRFVPYLGTIGLESQYPSYAVAQVPDSLQSSVRWVVVLVGNKVDNEALPPNDRLAAVGLTRLAEGIRLMRLHPEATLLLSGGDGFSEVPAAEISKQVALDLGVDSTRIATETKSRDTEEQARLVSEIVGRDTLVLVTSASHMPRAMALFRGEGITSIPAPTAHTVKEHEFVSLDWFYPSGSNLGGSEPVVYEYLGRFWSWLRGRTS